MIPLYAPVGRSAQTGKSSADLVREINQSNVHYADNFTSAYELVSKQFSPDTVVVFMGAGDIDEQLRAELGI